MKKGFVALVGAGPGDLGLLTIRAKELLETAEVVVYDRLVSGDILGLIPNNAEKINVGKSTNKHPVPQERINEILLEEALKNKNVVRLKGGDPFVFGRGGEELDLLYKNNIKFEVVPGITSSIAAASFAGIPVTHRDYCSSFHVITGHQKKNEPLNIDFESLVKTKGTLVFLMGLSSLSAITEGLISAGIMPNMPTALVENGTRAYQRKLVGTVSDICEKAEKEQFKSPCVIIVGKVCSLSNDFDWFSSRELSGENIIVTSPKSSDGKLMKKLKNLGANVHNLPSIEIKNSYNKEEFEAIIKDINAYSWLAFTSKNGVKIFFEELSKCGLDTRFLSGVKIACVGVSTANELKNYGVNADFIPTKYESKHLAQELVKVLNSNDNILLIRAVKGSDELSKCFDENKVNYKEYKVYDTQEITGYTQKVKEITSDKVLVCFTSASTVESFMKNNPNTHNITAVCIGSMTAEVAQKYNLNYVVSEKATIDSMVEKIIEIKK